MDVLNQLFNKVIKGGVIIFDEYYSLKYPGALMAVHDFFIDKVENTVLQKKVLKEYISLSINS